MAITIRPTEAADALAWRTLWRGYCEFYDAEVSDAVTASTWARILDAGQPVLGYVACTGDAVIGFANAVLHLNTWSTRPVCYLEDLFVAPEARKQGAARALIEALVARGREAGWLRVYWMTHADNDRARVLYDAITPVTKWVRYDVPIPARADLGYP